MAAIARDTWSARQGRENQTMSDDKRPRYDTNQAPLSPESQLRLLLGFIAVALFVIAGGIFLSSGDASLAFALLSFGLAAVAGCVMIPTAPAK